MFGLLIESIYGALMLGVVVLIALGVGAAAAKTWPTLRGHLADAWSRRPHWARRCRWTDEDQDALEFAVDTYRGRA